MGGAIACYVILLLENNFFDRLNRRLQPQQIWGEPPLFEAI